MFRPLLVVTFALGLGCSALTRPGEELRPDLPIAVPKAVVAAVAQPKLAPTVTAAITNLPSIPGPTEGAAPPPPPAAKGG